MSQDHRVIADFPHGLDSSRYDNSFNTIRVPNSPTGQVLEAGPGWPVLVMAMTGPD